MQQIKQLKKSMQYAFFGLKHIIKREQNFRLQLIFAILVSGFGFYVKLTKNEWIAVIILISAVLILEIINSALEQVIDIIKPRLHGQVKLVKDMMAAAVLVTAMSALVIGLIIFYPYLVEIF
jgi:undecaprenol kinase